MSPATKRLVENVKATHGRIDVLFVNAGISRFKPISMMDEAFFDALFDINVRGACFVMKNVSQIPKNRQNFCKIFLEHPD